MKLSAVVLLSVNLVAASQVAANAADTASFLQDALSPSSSAANASGQNNAQAPAKAARQATAAAKKRASKSYVAMTPSLDGVKIRPFMPGRYLPSESELQARREAEIAAKREAQLAAQQNFPISSGMLSGGVSANNMSELNTMIPAAKYALSNPANQDYIHRATQVALQKVKQAAKNFSASPRSIPGRNPVMPGQVAQLPGAPGIIPDIPEPQTGLMPVAVPQPPRPAAVQVPAPQQFNVAAPVVQPPALTSYEARQLDKLVESNMPENVYSSGINGDMRTGQSNPGIAGQGSPPFPLSNLPMGRGRGISTVSSQARFGSWHGGNSNLPQASFQSFVPVHMAGPMSIKVNHYSNSHRTGRQAASIAHPHSSGQAHPQAHLAKKAEKKDVPVAAYPPYRRYSLYL